MFVIKGRIKARGTYQDLVGFQKTEPEAEPIDAQPELKDTEKPKKTKEELDATTQEILRKKEVKKANKKKTKKSRKF
jgi:hypothetical protein